MSKHNHVHLPHAHALSAEPLRCFSLRTTTHILVQLLLCACCKATVTKQQSLGGRQSYRHGDPHSAGLGLSVFRRSRPGRTLPAGGEKASQHKINTGSHKLDTVLHYLSHIIDMFGFQSDFCWEGTRWCEQFSWKGIITTPQMKMKAQSLKEAPNAAARKKAPHIPRFSASAAS